MYGQYSNSLGIWIWYKLKLRSSIHSSAEDATTQGAIKIYLLEDAVTHEDIGTIRLFV